MIKFIFFYHAEFLVGLCFQFYYLKALTARSGYAILCVKWTVTVSEDFVAWYVLGFVIRRLLGSRLAARTDKI